MQTECSADLFGFAGVEGRSVVAGLVVGRGVETGICQYCRSLVSFHVWVAAAGKRGAVSARVGDQPIPAAVSLSPDVVPENWARAVSRYRSLPGPPS
jgi:hypothetical protein